MQFEDKTHFIFPTNCFVVDGAERSLIYDLHRIDYDIITKDLSAAMKECTSGSFTELFDHLPADQLDFYEPFVATLIKKEYLMPIDEDELENFAPMSTTWNQVYSISHAIVEFSKYSPYELTAALHMIDGLNCPAVEIRLPDSHDLIFFERLSRSIEGMIFRHVDLLIKYEPDQEIDFLFAVKKLHASFFSITQHSAPDDEIIRNPLGQYVGLKRKKTSYDALVDNHKVFPQHFYVNREFFAEAQQFNTFFHGKIAILKDGSLKNGSNQKHSFGNIITADLASLVKDPAFTLLGQIGKDQIAICKDCEYRYMCMDSRIPIKNDLGQWIHDELCNYDPFTCKWSNIE